MCILICFTLFLASYIVYLSCIGYVNDCASYCEQSFINGSLAASVVMLIDATPTWLPGTTAGASSFDYCLTIRAEAVGAVTSLKVGFAATPYIAKALELTWPMSAEVHRLIEVDEHTFAKHWIEPLKSDCRRCMHVQLMFLRSCLTYACSISYLRFDTSLLATKACPDSSCDSGHC